VFDHLFHTGSLDIGARVQAAPSSDLAMTSTIATAQQRHDGPGSGRRGGHDKGGLVVAVRLRPSSLLDSVVGSGVDDGGMRTSELAGQVGVNTETLRYYERRGLLQEPPRTPAGYRNYPSAAVELLRFIKRAQELGFTLDEVEELLHLDAGGPDSCDAARALAAARKADLEARIAYLQRMRDSLGELIATCGRDRADRSCALLEAIEDRSRPEPARSHQ
jgi:Hg(II)-responsive transcriptional regulator